MKQKLFIAAIGAIFFSATSLFTSLFLNHGPEVVIDSSTYYQSDDKWLVSGRIIWGGDIRSESDIRSRNFFPFLYWQANFEESIYGNGNILRVDDVKSHLDLDRRYDHKQLIVLLPALAMHLVLWATSGAIVFLFIAKMVARKRGAVKL